MLMIVGVSLFFAGTLALMVLMFANGGTRKSRQFVVLGEIWSGKLGKRRRLLVRSALLLTTSGAFLCFAAVAGMDAARASRCQQYCLTAGYIEGNIGPSTDRTREARFVACRCMAPDRPTLELRADAIAAEPAPRQQEP